MGIYLPPHPDPRGLDEEISRVCPLGMWVPVGETNRATTVDVCTIKYLLAWSRCCLQLEYRGGGGQKGLHRAGRQGDTGEAAGGSQALTVIKWHWTDSCVLAKRWYLGASWAGRRWGPSGSACDPCRAGVRPMLLACGPPQCWGLTMSPLWRRHLAKANNVVLEGAV